MENFYQTIAFIWENVFALSILFVFVSALFGVFIKARSVDKCLKDFADFAVSVTVAEDAYKGNMHLYPTGMELEYKEPQKTVGGFLGKSYILYKSEYPSIGMVARYQDELVAENVKRREKSIKRTYHPGLLKYLGRWASNVIGTFRDAFIQSLSLLLGHLKKANPSSRVLQTQDKHLKAIGTDIISHSTNTYDPILEKHIGKRVIVEHGENQ